MPDDIVLIKDDDTPRNQWRLSRVTAVTHDDDGLVRKVKLVMGDPNLSVRGERKGKPKTRADITTRRRWKTGYPRRGAKQARID